MDAATPPHRRAAVTRPSHAGLGGGDTVDNSLFIQFAIRNLTTTQITYAVYIALVVSVMMGLMVDMA